MTSLGGDYMYSLAALRHGHSCLTQVLTCIALLHICVHKSTFFRGRMASNTVMLYKRLLLIIIYIHLIATYAKEQSFWLIIDLLSVEWRKGCLTTAGCAEPRFRINEFNPISSERLSVSWAIADYFLQGQTHSFTSHWRNGTPMNILLNCEVSGIDPTYRFPRICDSTTNTKIFSTEGTQPPEEGEGKLVIELKGKCFNASLAAQRYTKNCPWCSTNNDIAISQEQYPDDERVGEFLFTWLPSEHLLYITVIVLASITLVSSIAFIFLLRAFCKQKSRFTRRKSRFVGCPDSLFHVESPCTSDSSRYDVPWDQKKRLPCWVNIESDETTSSPVDSSGSSNNHSKTILITTPPRKFSSTKRRDENDRISSLAFT